MLNFREKNEVKRSSHFGDLLCRRIKQSDLQRKFCPEIKNQTFNTLTSNVPHDIETNQKICIAERWSLMGQSAWNNWINSFISTNVYAICKNKHNSSIQSCHIVYLVLRIILGMPWCTWLNSYEWTKSYKYNNVCLNTCKKSNSHRLHFRDIPNLLFLITLAILDHTQLKWLNRFVTSTHP